MNCVIVGFGSIGQRHAKILKLLGCRVAVVTHRKIQFPLTYSSLSRALSQEKPEYIIIANQTDKHYRSLVELAASGFNGIVLVEKPLFHVIQEIPDNNFKAAYVGYNLRFHHILQKIAELINKDRTLYTQVYVGQYLPKWRPGRDYSMSYSAKKDQGGGVLLDLSHELDYLRWFFGEWSSMAAMGGKYSSLQIDSDDMYSLMLVMEKCPMAQIHVNYLDLISRREITVITEKYSIKADLVQQTLRINEQLLEYKFDCDYTYYMQHKAVINGTNAPLCTLAEGLNVLEMINAAEQSAKQRKWINK
ncbi:Gfo/Idh/MocA family protein [Desulfitibacter alkalitolerans]|uniref:Gfo/Idh/MocA family protein n=1 Tax=Desulfitibacter alkalitolerans TaxID=264641 RepID=UPI00048474E6|nr:Gfo/Idh/MocA family oxidoreductase [Desulfitibacter alkalitolerans]